MRFLVGKKEMQILSEKCNDNYNKIKQDLFCADECTKFLFKKEKKASRETIKQKKSTQQTTQCKSL